MFNRHGSPPVPLVPLVLDHNLRNTRQIATAFQPLVDHPMQFLGGDGPAMKFVPCSAEDAMNIGDDEVELLLEEGWRPEDVALLTTGTRHPEQRERQAAGSAAYLDSFGIPRRCSTGTCSGSRDWSDELWCWWSTSSRRSSGPGSGCTSGCRAPGISWWCAGTRSESRQRCAIRGSAQQLNSSVPAWPPEWGCGEASFGHICSSALRSWSRELAPSCLLFLLNCGWAVSQTDPPSRRLFPSLSRWR